jgi:deoxyribose-phosphate aldolase
MDRSDLAAALESTLLKPESTLEEIQALCDEAMQLGLAGVCVPPYFVKEARRRMEGRPQRVISVVGFPLGYSFTAAKVEEIKKMVHDGADEIDAVAPLTAIRSGNWNYVENDISAMAQIAHLKNRPLKLIIESGMLRPEEIRQVCAIAERWQVEFIKTSTGMLAPGPDESDIRFLRELLKPSTRIKASAGIRTAEKAIALMAAGAARIGTSAAAAIMAGWEKKASGSPS